MVAARALGSLLTVALLATSAAAQTVTPEPEPPPVRLDPVTVVAPPPATTSSEMVIPRRDLELLPPGRPAEALRLIPGFIINQHQGGGKAEQYLLRGFDADHGTDVALRRCPPRQPAQPRPRPGLCRPPLPDPRDDPPGRGAEGAVLRRVRGFRHGRRGELRHPRRRRRERRAG